MARRHTEGATVPEESGASQDVPSKIDHPALEPSPGTFARNPVSRGRLTPDWLPVALIVGDAVIAAISVPAGYWIKYGNADQTLPFGPYLAAIPVVVVLYLFSLGVTGQYRSATLSDWARCKRQLLSSSRSCLFILDDAVF